MNWTFVNPWMLGALAAVGLPVLIHYLTRARSQRIVFPPFKFLQAACAGQQAMHRLRTIVLLTVRTLAVLALVLLFARPFLKPSGAANRPGAATRVVLLLDASLSMRAVQRGVPLFARAQAEAADVLRALESGSEAGVILAGATPQPMLPALSRNIPALHQELIKAQATFEKADPMAALTLAAKMLGDNGTIYVFSDFQKSNWESVRELPNQVVCRFRPVTTEPVENVALTSLRTVPAEPLAGEPVEIIATVFNGTPRPRQETVRFELSALTQERRVTVPPFGFSAAVLNSSFEQPGPVAGKASLAPDDLREDNVRHFAVGVNKALQILLISDSDIADPRSASFFVARALAPSPQAAPGLTIVRRHSQDADRGVLETADLFLVVAPAMLTGETVEIIERRVNDGARFVAFLDGPTAPMLMVAAFAPPFQLQRALTSEAGVQLTAGARRLFTEGDANDLTALRFHRYYQNQVLPGRGGDVMLSYPDGSAALTLSTVGRGAAIFANLPLTPDSGDFIGHPMFPALLHEMMRTLRRGVEEEVVTPGTARTIDVLAPGEGNVTVTDPDGRAIEARVVAKGRMTRLALPAVPLPGVYLVKQGDQLVATAAVNIDPRESDTRPLALESLQRGRGTDTTVIRDEADLLVAAKTRPFWPQLAVAAAILLGLEMLLLALWRRPGVQGAGLQGFRASGVQEAGLPASRVETARAFDEVAR